MIVVEKRQRETDNQNLFAMPYVGQLVVSSFSGIELNENEQLIVANKLSKSDQRIKTTLLDSDEFLPKYILTLFMEAEGDREALQCLCNAAINGWLSVCEKADDLEFVESHLVYEPILVTDHNNDPSIDISSPKYTIEDLELPELDVFGDPVVIEAREVFYRARDNN